MYLLSFNLTEGSKSTLTQTSERNKQTWTDGQKFKVYTLVGDVLRTDW